MDIIEDIEDDLDYFFNDLQENKELLQNINELKIAFNEYYDLLKQLEKQVLIKELTKIGSNTISIFDEDFKLLDQNLRTELFSILANVEQLIGYKFNNTNLHWQALIDPEDEKLGKNTLCGKLAFLGDAALKLALSDLLIEIDISNATLDKLSKARSSFESNIFLAKIFDKISLKDYVLTNRLMIPNDEHWKGTVMEAIIGAIYLEGGINSVKRLIIGWKPDLLAKNII